MQLRADEQTAIGDDSIGESPHIDSRLDSSGRLPFFQTYTDLMATPEYAIRVSAHVLIIFYHQALQRDDLDAVIFLCEALLQKKPYDTKAASDLAKTYEKAQRFREALHRRLKIRSRATDPENERMIAALQQVISEEETVNSATYEDLQKRPDLLRKTHTHHLAALIGEACSRKNWPAVEFISLEMLRREPYDIKALATLGAALEGLGKFQEALDIMECLCALDLSPINLRRLVRLRTVVKLTKVEQATPRFENYRELIAKPEHLPRVGIYYLSHCAAAAVTARDWASSEILNREILKREPGNSTAKNGLSTALENMGKFEEAISIREALVRERIMPDKNSLRVDEMRKKMGVAVRATLAAGGAKVTAKPQYGTYEELLANPTDIPNIPPATLVRFAAAAARDRRWVACATLNEAILQRDPANETAAKMLAAHRKRHGARTMAVVPQPIPDAPQRLVEKKKPPEPEITVKRANIDRSRLDNFLNSLARESSGWEDDESGNQFKKIPREERATLRGLIDSFESELNARGLGRKKIPKGKQKGHEEKAEEAVQLDKFWNKFDQLKTHIFRDKLQPSLLASVIGLLPDADWGKGDFASGRDRL